ncbi:integral membrane protein, YkoY family [Calidithermus terrae]|uniref:Integral membrane protein, YkoY family n=1 Tax=Calidithermus terrae TaxID=1408545 RepID=A0A399ET55_9DEIN|nr:hypothetical protein [Calidithermus terrae]RIH86249.1 integral membrane protein, YkoY family [Calidithermus terrae]
MDFGTALLVIATIVVLEAVLSVDNAVVLAVMVRPLPPDQRGQALLYGLVGAYVLRGLALFFATVIIQVWWIQVLGGVYLVYLAVQHLLHHRRRRLEGELPPGPPPSFWRVVVMLNVVDLVFAIDSVLVVVAFSTVLWVIFTGVAIGILLIRLAAGWMVRVMEHYPRLEQVAYAVVGWAGLKLVVEGWAKAAELMGRPELAPHLPQAVFWAGTLGILLVGGFLALRAPQPDPVEDDAQRD